jgi:hypothetical protein
MRVRMRRRGSLQYEGFSTPLDEESNEQVVSFGARLPANAARELDGKGTDHSHSSGAEFATMTSWTAALENDGDA